MKQLVAGKVYANKGTVSYLDTDGDIVVLYEEGSAPFADGSMFPSDEVADLLDTLGRDYAFKVASKGHVEDLFKELVERGEVKEQVIF